MKILIPEMYPFPSLKMEGGTDVLESLAAALLAIADRSSIVPLCYQVFELAPIESYTAFRDAIGKSLGYHNYATGWALHHHKLHCTDFHRPAWSNFIAKSILDQLAEIGCGVGMRPEHGAPYGKDES